MKYICITCGVQFADSVLPPEHCAICEDERQYVGHGGQKWTTLKEMGVTYRNQLDVEGPELISMATEPKFAIGQRALHVRAGTGILWDCISFIDDRSVGAVQALGGVSAIAISHPHYYSSMIEWSRALGDVPIYLHAADGEWVMRPHPAIVFWHGETHDLAPGLTLIRCGGHFPGGTVLHWAAGAQGKGALLTGRRDPGGPGPEDRELHVQLSELHPARPPGHSADRGCSGAVRVRGDLRSMVWTEHPRECEGSAAVLGGQISGSDPGLAIKELAADQRR